MTALTTAELDKSVASLRSVGGVYEILAQIVENQNRPKVTNNKETHA